MPPIGFGLGIAIAVRFRNVRAKHGAWIIAISIVAAIVWILILSSGTLNSSTTTSDY